MKNKVLLFTRNGLVGHLILHDILPRIIAMGLSPIIVNTGEPEASGKPVCKELKDIGFYETGLLKNIVFPFMDEIDPDDKNSRVQSLKQISQAYKLEYFETGDFNQPYFVEFLSKRTDIIGGISFRILTIFRQDLLELFQNNNWFLWNLHTGILPEYRGVHIPFRALYNKENDYGYTLHEIDSGIDTGNIIHITRKKLNYDTPVFNAYIDHISMGADCIVHSLQFYQENGFIASHKQNDHKAVYYSFPTANDFADYERASIKFMKSSNDVIIKYLDYFAPQGSYWRESLKKLLIQSVILHENSVDVKDSQKKGDNLKKAA